MFQNTPQIALEGCLVNLKLPQNLFICSGVLGELWSVRTFWVALSFHLKLLATWMLPVESLGHGEGVHLLENSMAHFVLMPKSSGSLNNNCNILVIKCGLFL